VTAAIAAPGEPEDDADDRIVERCWCACGRLAAIVFDVDGDEMWCWVRCGCGSFLPAPRHGDRP
jgi:hypothetical protein